MSDFILKPGDKLKALSLWPPWSWAIPMGEKEYETRDWFPKNPPEYIAIHSAQRYTTSQRMMFLSFNNRFPDLCWHGVREFGAVLCVCKLGAIYRVEDIRDQLSKRELAFGNYSDGRFAWKLEVVYIFKKPIPARGFQKIWNWTYPGEMRVGE